MEKRNENTGKNETTNGMPSRGNDGESKVQVFNLIILDKSGSMSSIERAAVAGFNETVGGIRSAQKQFAATQEHYVSLLTFCSCKMEYVYDCVPVDEVKTLTSKDYQPCCGTPLYDAMGHGINDMLKKTKDVEGATVVVTVITDGEENSSTEYSGKAIKALVDKMHKDYGWNFAYIGTNQDVEAVAVSLSITNTMLFEDTEAGMTKAWEKERKSKQRMYSRMDEAVNCCMDSASPISAKDRISRVQEMMRANKNYEEAGAFSHRVTPELIRALRPGQVFVFGSNGHGAHCGGAALAAVRHFGAVMGQAEGMQGDSYAINSMDGLKVLQEQAERFVHYAKEHPERTFLVTAIGCGIAGYTPREVAPLFVKAVDVDNIWLPQEFWDELV